ncbi:MAG: undecaprenyl/decaprenyl-phosphate alpha-N-acetylglucosaminyl 1-phosphate transferase [Deltaproteobacteria bacterium]|nr:undecaprenyl/decaprenyl-phosphate alpha-N-acetylglucosaminyl 1-phosphate transferase [Deltaproteobacteria bacterium]
MGLLVSFLLSFFVAISLIPLLGRLSFRFGFLDVPNARKVHTTPVPRVGGICMVIGTFISSLFFFEKDPFLKWFFLATSIIFISGIIDDIYGHGPWSKFFAQVLAALVIIVFGNVKIINLGALLPEGWLIPDYVSVPLTLIAIVGVTNAINLADGLDGLAGGICLFIFACLTFIAYLLENTLIAFLSIAISGAIFGFLHFNTHPATIFMGDTGSQFLGFSAITIAIKISQEEATLSPLIPVLLLGFPVLDTLTVMIQRYKEGRPILRADRNHFHHKLMGLGFSHSEAVLIIYMIQAVLTFFAFSLRFHSEWLILIGYLLFASLVILSFHLAERKGYSFKKGGFLDRIRVIREWKKTGAVVKITFPVLQIGVPILFILSLFIPKDVHREVSIFAIGSAVFLFVSFVYLKGQVGLFLRIALYLLIPYVIYVGDTNSLEWLKVLNLKSIYDFSFFVVAMLAAITVRFSRRSQGFKATPMDFLILFFVIVFARFSFSMTESKDIGLIAIKVVTLFYSYEVLLGELRGEYNKLLVFTFIALFIVSIRGLIPIPI